jgi:hypothetical protein
MSLLAEEIVEEWLNRSGFFTIRGIKVGVNEIDILAVRCAGDTLIRRHIEVQSSVNPVAYLSPVPKLIQKRTGLKRNSAKTRTQEELSAYARDWVRGKFQHPSKEKMRQLLCPGKWEFELVANQVKSEPELLAIQALGIKVVRLGTVVEELCDIGTPGFTATGRDLMDLISHMRSLRGSD